MNWGKGIGIFLTIFVLFILGLAYMATRSNVDLEADDYYQQEIAYQQRIEGLERGSEAAATLRVAKTDKGVVLVIDQEKIDHLTDGKIQLKRPNDSSLDVEFPATFNKGSMQISKEKLKIGLYNMLLTWQSPDGEYVIEQDLRIE